MLEIWINTQSKVIADSPGVAKEYPLPPFYCGEQRKIRLHCINAGNDPTAPTEFAPTSVMLSLCDSARGVAVNATLSAVVGQLYFEGLLTIPITTELIPSGETTADLFLGGQIVTTTETIFFEKNVVFHHQA